MTNPVVDLAALNRSHRDRQVANAAQVQLLTTRLFLELIDPTNITGTAQRWMTQVIRAILDGRRTAHILASAYAMAIRRLQVPDAPPFTIPRPPDPPIQQLVRSLTYTGPGKLAVDLAKTPDPGPEPERSAPEADHQRWEREVQQYEETVQELPKKAAMQASGAAFRHVVNGGRDTIQTVIASDPVAVGYMRVARDKPCAFCLMLVSRGPVYSKTSFDQSDPRFEGPGEHKVHDFCGCSLMPLYGGTSTRHWTEQARQAEQLWIKHAARFSGAEARKAFAHAAREAGLADLSRW